MDTLSVIFNAIFTEEETSDKYESNESTVKRGLVLNGESLASNSVVLYNTGSPLQHLVYLVLDRISRLYYTDSTYSKYVVADKTFIQRFGDIFVCNPDLYFVGFNEYSSSEPGSCLAFSSVMSTRKNSVFVPNSSKDAADIFARLSRETTPILLYKRELDIQTHTDFYNRIVSKFTVPKVKRRVFLDKMNDARSDFDIVAIHDSTIYFL